MYLRASTRKKEQKFLIMCSREKLHIQRLMLEHNKSGYAPDFLSSEQRASRLHTHYFTLPPGDVHVGEDVEHKPLLHRELLQLHF